MSRTLRSGTGEVAEQYRAARNRTAVFDRSTQGTLEVNGTEALVFLHNLTTNDLKNLPPDAGCEGFFCTATAKVVAHGWFWRRQPVGKRDTLWIDLAPGLAEKVLPHLDHYLISEDVNLVDRSAELARFHVAGPNLHDSLRAIGIDGISTRPGTLHAADPLTFCVFEPLGLPGVDILCPVSHADALWQRLLDAGVTAAESTVYDTLRIEAGMPVYGVDITDATFAPETGRIPQAICYTKGCYLGQEPIVMARDRGMVQRLFVGLHFPEGQVPAGSLLFADDKEVGRVTGSVWSPKLEKAVGLGYVRRAKQTPGTELTVAVEGGRRPAIVAGLPLVGG